MYVSFSKFAVILFYLFAVSLFEISASTRTDIHYLNKDFSLNYQSHKRSYSLTFEDNYLRFQFLGRKRGFYIKSCNKEVVQAIDRTLYATLSALNREMLLIPQGKEEAIKGKLTINSKELPIYQSSHLQPSLEGLHMNLSTLMNQAEVKCKK